MTKNRNVQELTMMPLLQKMWERIKATPLPSWIVMTSQQNVFKKWWTISEEERKETEMSTREQNQNPIWFEKRKRVLTASYFGKAAKTKVEPSNKLKAMLYSKFTTEAVQYRTESKEVLILPIALST